MYEDRKTEINENKLNKTNPNCEKLCQGDVSAQTLDST